jgi:hypothetical protein
MSDSLVFLGDIKGTTSSLETLRAGGGLALEKRIAALQDAFAGAFLRYADRSQSLLGATFSDSVVAYWADPVEGLRVAGDLMLDVWGSLDHLAVRFRGFLGRGPAVAEVSALQHALHRHPRFRPVLPCGVAIWSVAVAEAAHFPDGLFVAEDVAEEMSGFVYGPGTMTADLFRFRQLVGRRMGCELRRYGPTFPLPI